MGQGYFITGRKKPGVKEESYFFKKWKKLHWKGCQRASWKLESGLGGGMGSWGWGGGESGACLGGSRKSGGISQHPPIECTCVSSFHISALVPPLVK